MSSSFFLILWEDSGGHEQAVTLLLIITNDHFVCDVMKQATVYSHYKIGASTMDHIYYTDYTLI